MASKELNLGIVAHVDAGKTTLTERLLYAAGVIGAVGSVDSGTTQTDTLALERRRGITIRAAVASFDVGDTHVNLIDTPGHPDFIAEVERSLRVLDGAVLVISAVESVQPQTRILMRALQRLRLPTLLFVNKTDRVGADVERVLRQVGDRLTPYAAPAELLDDELAQLVRRAEVYPVFAGSALTGDGVEQLLHALSELLPAAAGDADAPLAATVFKLEHRVPYVRLWNGTLRVRQQLEHGKVTSLEVFEHGGTAVQRPSVAAGGVAKVHGLADLHVGDRIGARGTATLEYRFPPPTLEAVVAPRDPADAHALHAALVELAEQDPLIDVRHEDGVLSVSLYGDVQQQVIEATLAEEYGLDVEFREPTVVYVERPVGSGEAVEILNKGGNPFSATVGLRVEPGPVDSGVAFRLDVLTRTIPLYVYKSRELFEDDMARSVRSALRDGLYGWRVTDCIVTMTACEYASADGPPSKRGSMSMPADYRGLTPLVLGRALAQAGTVVCEPILQVSLEVPTASLGTVLGVLGRVGAVVETPTLHGDLATVEATLAAAHATQLQRELPRVTSGEGVFESTFAGYRRVAGEPPTRRRLLRTSASGS